MPEQPASYHTCHGAQGPTDAPWPDGVALRFLTVANATVDLYDGGPAACLGCGSTSEEDWRDAKAWAQAERCRALPRPAGDH